MLPALAAVVVIAAVAWRSLDQVAARSRPESPADKPLPHHAPQRPQAPTTPERLIDERQVSQSTWRFFLDAPLG